MRTSCLIQPLTYRWLFISTQSISWPEGEIGVLCLSHIICDLCAFKTLLFHSPLKITGKQDITQYLFIAVLYEVFGYFLTSMIPVIILIDFNTTVNHPSALSPFNLEISSHYQYLPTASCLHDHILELVFKNNTTTFKISSHSHHITSHALRALDSIIISSTIPQTHWDSHLPSFIHLIFSLLLSSVDSMVQHHNYALGKTPYLSLSPSVSLSFCLYLSVSSLSLTHWVNQP